MQPFRIYFTTTSNLGMRDLMKRELGAAVRIWFKELNLNIKGIAIQPLANSVFSYKIGLDSAIRALNSKELNKLGKEILQKRLETAIFQKYWTKGFGHWRNISPVTVRWRRWLMKKYGLTGFLNKPLWFTGTLMKNIQKNYKITGLQYFVEALTSKNIFSVSKPTIVARLYFKDLVDVPEEYYFHSFSSFWQIIRQQRKFGWDMVLTTKGGEKSEFYEYVWQPFYQNDFYKVFQSVVKQIESARTEKVKLDVLTFICKKYGLENLSQRLLRQMRKREIDFNEAKEIVRQAINDLNKSGEIKGEMEE